MMSRIRMEIINETQLILIGHTRQTIEMNCTHVLYIGPCARWVLILFVPAEYTLAKTIIVCVFFLNCYQPL